MEYNQSPRDLAHSDEWCNRLSEWESRSPERHELCERIRDLKQTIARDLDQFRLVFPEYTPHDVPLHADRLVRIAAAILPGNLSRLNVVEYLVFTAAIYAHDWGMAVDEEEKGAIKRIARQQAERAPTRGNGAAISLLPDEGSRFADYFGDSFELTRESGGLDLSDTQWTDYLRETHGLRSGARVRAYFREVHSRFGEYVALVAEGHLAAEEEIADTHRYRSYAAPVLDDGPLNLQALAIYLRLIDLFDISDERTPYSLWRFVNPQERDSKIEWSKHLSLAPVRLDEDTGALVFQGEVKDPDVWARVCDLRAYSEQQFAFSRALLSKRAEAKYHLPFHWLDWDGVIPRDISSDVIRFEFDRNALFTILAEEVYDKDPYVFIRELLQNAIDAMEARKQVLMQRRADLPAFAPIVIHCDSKPEGDYTFIIEDAGLGMDSFIIRNYLAMAGKSFYRSTDFQKLGIEYDAISRFGIGILSCFMVADSIDIETLADPNAFSESAAIRLRIGQVSAHWSVIRGSPDCAIGTKVRVNVSAHKVAMLREEASDVSLKEWGLSRSQLGVTQYLKAIAGFVRYPILVNENGTKTAILHPDYDETVLPSNIRNEYCLHRLPMVYPIDRAVTPGSVSIASRFFQIETLRMKQDLGIDGIEGAISFPVPVDRNFLIGQANPTELDSVNEIKFYTYQGGFINRRSMSLCESGARDRYVACFCNGIFVPGVKYPPQLWEQEARSKSRERCGTWALSGVQLFLNLERRRLNAARTHLAGGENWADEALAAVGRHLIARWREELLANEPIQRLRLLCRYGQFYPISLFDVADSIGVENWPVCLLAAQGRIEVIEWRNFSHEDVATIPGVLQEACGLAVEKLLRGQNEIRIPWLASWEGPPLLVEPWSSWIGCSHYEALVRMPLLKSGFQSETRWSTPPLPGLPPIELEVWGVPPTDTAAECSAGRLTRKEMKEQASGWCGFDHNDDRRYPSAFDSYCFWGPRLVNSRHPLGTALLNVILLTKQCPALSWRTPEGDRVMHWFSSFLERSRGGRELGVIDYSALDRKLGALAELVGSHAPTLASQLATYKTGRSDFLPGVFNLRRDGTLRQWGYRDHYSSDAIPLFHVLQQETVQPWGRILDYGTQWPTWAEMEQLILLDESDTP